MSKGIFITGTGTDVGKTYVTGLIVKKLHDAGKKYWKDNNRQKENLNLKDKEPSGDIIVHLMVPLCYTKHINEVWWNSCQRRPNFCVAKIRQEVFL